MKIVQTFWNAKNEDLLKSKGGYLCPEINWMAWTYSCLQLHKFYPQIELYTDRRSKDFFELLKLPYTQIYTTSDDNEFMKDCLPDVWAYAKLDTYSHQEEPFLHIDGDVFIKEPFSMDLLSSPLIVQGFEENMDIYRETFATLDKYLKYKPTWFLEGLKNPHAYNAGIIGGTDMDFFKRYVKIAQEFYIQNQDSIRIMKENEENTNAINLIFEQYLFYYLVKTGKKTVSYFSDFVVKKAMDNEYFFRVDDDWEYVHLMGNTKKFLYMNMFVSRILKKDYPQKWEEIVFLYEHSNVGLSDVMKHIIEVDKGKKVYINTFNKNVKRIQEVKGKLQKEYTEENICRYLRETFFDITSLEENFRSHPIFRDIQKFQDAKEHFLKDLHLIKRVKQLPFVSNEVSGKYVFLTPYHKFYTTEYNWSEIYSFEKDEHFFIRKKQEVVFLYMDVLSSSIFYLPMSMSSLIMFKKLMDSPIKIVDLLKDMQRAKGTNEDCLKALRMLYYNGLIYLSDKESDFIKISLPMDIGGVIERYKKQVEYCVDFCLDYYDRKRKFYINIELENFTIGKMLAIMKQVGFDALGVKVKRNEIDVIPRPSILLFQQKKTNDFLYVVLTKVKNNEIEVYNPQIGRKEWIRKECLSILWEGKAILFQSQKSENNV